jgi:hypothetical protein
MMQIQGDGPGKFLRVGGKLYCLPAAMLCGGTRLISGISEFFTLYKTVSDRNSHECCKPMLNSKDGPEA